MNLEGKLRWQIAALALAAFAVLTFVIGFLYAVAIGLFAYLVWQAYSRFKLMRWWKKEPVVNRQIIEFINERMNEGKSSRNLWIRSLADPDAAELSKDYRVEMMARPLIIEKQSNDLIESWIDWGSGRLGECVLGRSSEELNENLGEAASPVLMIELMVSKAAFEIAVSEHALRLLGFGDPRGVITPRTIAKALETHESDIDLAWASRSETLTTALTMLTKELRRTP